MTLFDCFLDYITRITQGEFPSPVELAEGDEAEQTASLTRAVAEMGVAEFVKACAAKEGRTLPEALFAPENSGLDVLAQMTEQPPEETAAPAAETAAPPADFAPDFLFSTVDDAGGEWSEQAFAEARLTMINFWEPWCGPCVSEMPEIEKLYENYKDKGLYIIGVFSATDQLDDVKSVVKSAGTTYPIAIYDQAFDIYQTGYVPTTIFIDQNGHILPSSNGYSEHAIVGANSYENWAELVESFLK